LPQSVNKMIDDRDVINSWSRSVAPPSVVQYAKLPEWATVLAVWHQCGRMVGEGGAGWALIIPTKANERGNEGYQKSGVQRNTLHWPRAHCCCNWLAIPTFPMSCLHIIVRAVWWQWQLILRQSNMAVQTDVNYP